MNSIVPDIDIVPVIIPVNLATAANNGLRVKMDDCRKLAFVLFKGVGTQGEDPTITILQADAAAAGNTKAVNFTRVYKKQAVALAATDAWTEVTQAAGNTFTHAELAEQQAIVVIEIDAESLDRDNGYNWVVANIADVGKDSQIGGVLAIKIGLRNAA